MHALEFKHRSSTSLSVIVEFLLGLHLMHSWPSQWRWGTFSHR